TVVPVQLVLPEISTENVIKAVVVVVPNADAIGPTDRLQSRFLGNVGKSPVTIVFVEPVRRAGRSLFEASSRKQEKIHPTVVVVVNECAPAAIRLQDEFVDLLPTIDCRCVQSGLGSNVHKVCVEGTPRGSLSGHRFGSVPSHALAEEAWCRQPEGRPERSPHKCAPRTSHSE